MRPTEAELVQYQVTAGRRLQWDYLVWQVPMLALTAQAFLFAIALGAGDRWNRAIASGLIVLTAYLSVTLMARHRQAELADAEWLCDFEERHKDASMQALHGHAFRDRRDAHTQVAIGAIARLVPLRPGFTTWIAGILTFGLGAVFALVRAATGR